MNACTPQSTSHSNNKPLQEAPDSCRTTFTEMLETLTDAGIGSVMDGAGAGSETPDDSGPKPAAALAAVGVVPLQPAVNPDSPQPKI